MSLDTKKFGKLVSKVEDVVGDIDRKHYSDAVIHSKMLIDYLVFKALKELNAKETLIRGKNVSDEEKFGFLLDKGVISESVFDNCLIAKGVRNPAIHGLAYPNEHFAIGSVVSVLELYYNLQLLLKLPQLDAIDIFAKNHKVYNPMVFSIETTRAVNWEEYKKIEEIVANFPGNCISLITFPEHTIMPNGKEMIGVQMNEKVRYCNDLEGCFKVFDFVSRGIWVNIDAAAAYPNLEKYSDKPEK